MTGIAGLQAAVQTPKHVLGVQLQNVSLRMLHKKRQSAIQRPFVKALQTSLRTTPLGKLFFSQIATKKVSTHQPQGSSECLPNTDLSDTHSCLILQAI